MRFEKSRRLEQVHYEIRGPVHEAAGQLEESGIRVTRLNIGNLAPFGFDAPDEMLRDMIHHLRDAQGYVDSKGLYGARKAIMQECQIKGIDGVETDDVFVGNGVSELILMVLQAFLNEGDEILVPSPDYPLWTSAVTLSGGRAVHYRCDESAGWMPDLADIQRKTTSRTRALVIINPNNPTGAVYERETLASLVAWAEEKKLVVFSDEIYDKVLYDDARHIATASLGKGTLFFTFGGLSKVYRACGFRAGWMVASGALASSRDLLKGITTLSSMRLCSNVPAQFAIQAALGGRQSIYDFTRPGGRLYRQRELALDMLGSIPGLSCVRPRGAFYMFPRLDRSRFPISDDQQFVLDLLQQKHVLVVQGTGFNWPEPDHFRLTFLPHPDELELALGHIRDFLLAYDPN